MTFSSLRNRVMQAAGATMSLFALCAPASAFTISDLSPASSAPQPNFAVYQGGVDKPKLDEVWCRWGCGGPALLGGLFAGALIGGALAAPYYGYGGPYYGGPYYGGPYYAAAPYPACWRSVWTSYGWRRVWVC